MTRSFRSVLMILSLLAPLSAAADDGATVKGAPLGAEKIREVVQSMLDRLASVGPKPEGFVPPPDPKEPGERGVVSGVVEMGDRPAEGSKVLLLWVSMGIVLTSRVPSVSTGRDGRFEFSDVPVGQYRVVGETSEGWWESTESISVSAEQPGVDLKIRLGTARLTVVVIGQDFLPIRGALVSVDSAVEGKVAAWRPIETDADGVATLRLFHDGDVILRAVVGGAMSLMAIRPSEGNAPVRLMMPPIGTVDVTISGWDSSRDSASVSLTSDSESRPAVLVAQVDSGGSCRIRCAPGEWKVTLESARGPRPRSSVTIRVRAGKSVLVPLSID